MRLRSISPILIATGNPGKVREMRSLLADILVGLRSLADYQDICGVAETGSTFNENARLKAVGYARQTRLWSLADDSGLEVAALNGEPGVYSARYGGDEASFQVRMGIILEKMKISEYKGREARFACSMALADPDGRLIAEVEGDCTGRISFGPMGSGGFGYDPIFIPNGFDKTFGELPESIKQNISHRARAAKKIIRYLLDFTGTLT